VRDRSGKPSVVACGVVEDLKRIARPFGVESGQAGARPETKLCW
jgi:hypothetical protein